MTKVDLTPAAVPQATAVATRYGDPMTRLGKPTGPKPGFSRADVVEAALALGVADFTLTAVAGRLGVAVSGLYRTIASREDLLAACLEQVAAEMELSRPGATWQEALRAHAESMWALLERYPGLAGVIMSVPWAHQIFADLFAEAHQTLVDRGLGPEDAGVVLDFVGDTVITMHAQIEVMRSPAGQAAFPSPPGAAGGRASEFPEDRKARPTGLEEASRFAAARARAMPAVLTPDESWIERGGLDRKIEIIIRGVEASAPGPDGRSGTVPAQPTVQPAAAGE